MIISRAPLFLKPTPLIFASPFFGARWYVILILDLFCGIPANHVYASSFPLEVSITPFQNVIED